MHNVIFYLSCYINYITFRLDLVNLPFVIPSSQHVNKFQSSYNCTVYEGAQILLLLSPLSLSLYCLVSIACYDNKRVHNIN